MSRCLPLVLLVLAQPAFAQTPVPTPPPIAASPDGTAPVAKRTLVQRVALDGMDKDLVTEVLDAPAQFSAQGQTDPFEQIGYVLSGQLLLRTEGRPTLLYGTGEAFEIPRGAKHDLTTPEGAKLLLTEVVDKPLAAPASAVAPSAATPAPAAKP